jgi:hypothetical protein
LARANRTAAAILVGVRRLLIALGSLAVLAGCGGGSDSPSVTLDERVVPAPKPEPAKRGPTAHCPKDAANCRAVRGFVVYVQAVDPDGDGDAHIAVVDRRSLTYPGVAVIKLTRDMRPRRLPRQGDEVAAAGPIQKSSDGSPEIRAGELHVGRR